MAIETLGDEELAGRARKGCERSFSIIFQRHHPRVYRFALDLCASPSIAEEAAQEVFLALLSELDRYDPQRGSLLPYLLGVARHQTYRLLRRERGFVPYDMGGEGESRPIEPAVMENVLADLQKQESIEMMRSLVAGLPTAYREALALCDLEELDYAQASQVLGCPIGTVRSRLHRARAMLFEKWNAEMKRAASPARCSA